MTFFPSITETIGRNQHPIDLPSRLLQDRIVYLSGEITSDISDVIAMQLLWLDSNDPIEPINLYINSPGGSVYAGLAIKDIISSISCPVNTIGLGMCASMGAYLLSAGTGTRRALPNCRVMIHSVSGGMRGTFHDMAVDFSETEYLQTKMLEHIAEFSKGKTDYETLKDITARDRYMSVQQCIELGLLDGVVEPRASRNK